MIDSKIVIEIRGIGFPNKGAELMMLAIIEHFKGQDIHWCMAPKNDFIHRMSYPLWQKAEINYKGVNIAAPISLFPWKLRRFFGLVKESEIDYIFDASGFAYGDQWGIKNTQRLANDIVKWKKQNKKVILFPQAFGPFNNASNASLMKTVCEHADLIFARDQDSFNALKAISNIDNISLSPDFTPSLNVNSNIVDTLKGKICFIPNTKMLIKGDALEKQYYLDFFVELINLAIEQKQHVILLSHDGQRDEKLIDAIQQKLTSQVPSFYIDSALALKQTISESKVVISSRFHGLVSALSNGIPVIATGWSHKYQNLLADYDSENALFRSSEIDAAKNELINLIANPDYYASRQQRLLECQKNHDVTISRMWTKVEQLLMSKKAL
jgi:polysaccharide pyruvyl transferase WcaK-like protein